MRTTARTSGQSSKPTQHKTAQKRPTYRGHPAAQLPLITIEAFQYAHAWCGGHLPSVAKEREVSQSILKTWIEQHKKEIA